MASNMNLPAPIAGTLPAINEVKSNLEELTKIGIVDNNDYEYAAGMLKNIKHHQKKAEELEENEKRQLLDDLKKIRDKWKPIRDGWLKVERDTKTLMSKYLENQRKALAAAQVKLNEEVAKKRERLIKQADKAAGAGRLEQAALISDQAASIVAPVLQSETPKIDGQSTRDVWHYEVIDESKVDVAYKCIDHKKLGKVVQTLKESAKSLTGIRVWKTIEIASTAEQPEIE